MLSGCMGYSGPPMGKVMTQYCQNNTRFQDFYNCVNRFWYQPIQAQGYSGNSQVIYAMSVGANLLNGVRAGQITDADAIYRWQSTQLSLHQQEQASNARRAQALQNLGQSLQNYGNNQPTNSYSPQTTGTAFLKNEYTQGLNKVCVYDRVGSVDTLVIGAAEICPLTK